jgi:hypothetical protein
LLFGLAVGLFAAGLGLTTTVGLNFRGGGGMNPATGMGDKSYSLDRVLGGIEMYTRILLQANKRAEETFHTWPDLRSFKLKF